MRLFTAIDLSDDVLRRLDRLLNTLRPEAFMKWSPLDNLHVTLKFIGEWPAERVVEIEGELRKLVPRDPFDVEVRDLGWFPNERSPRVLWAGVHGGAVLENLARDTEELLAGIGVRREDRAFSPHLTLARIKNAVPLDSLRSRVNELQPAVIGSFKVSRFCLYRSDPGSQASVYRKLRVFNFESARAAS
jgi:RNA 2',3'-cyclic 3'-phosphodiesterase